MPRSAPILNSMAAPTPMVTNPARNSDHPETRPRRVFGTVLPSTSLDATEHRPRARLNNTRQPSSAPPAIAPSRVTATMPIAATARPCSTQPITKVHLRIGCCRTQAAISSCGNKEPDSRIGTRKAISAVGAASADISHASTVFGLAIASPSLVRNWVSTCKRKFPGTTRQASPEMSVQTRASSSFTRSR